MTFAQSLSAQQRGRAKRCAIYSALCGCIAEMAIDTSVIVVVYIEMLGGDDSARMFATGFSSVAAVLCSLAFGSICDRFGMRRAMSTACYGAFAAFVAMALAPLAGPARLHFFLGACFLYSLTRPLYVACWYPILDNFLRPEDRSGFFATMRFCYSSLNACLIFGLGRVFAAMGGRPPLWLILAILGVCAVANLGRKYFANSIPLAPEFQNPPLSVALHRHGQQYSLKEGLRISLRNAPLVGFCVYFCLFNIAAASYVPLSVVYMKSAEFNARPSAIMTVTAVSLFGSLSGYLFSSKILKAAGTKAAMLACHIATAVLPLVLFFCSPTSPHRLLTIGLVQYASAFVAAEIAVINSTESLALARPGNKTIALALCNVFCNIGTAVGRFGVSAVLAVGLLAPEWTFHGMTAGKFQSIFLFDSLMAVFFLVLLVLFPAFVPKHEDYYEP